MNQHGSTSTPTYTERLRQARSIIDRITAPDHAHHLAQLAAALSASPQLLAGSAAARTLALDLGVQRGLRRNAPVTIGASTAPGAVRPLVTALLALILDPRWVWCPHKLDQDVVVAPAGAAAEAETPEATEATEARRWVRVLLLAARRALCLNCLALTGRAMAEGAPVALVDLPALEGRCDLCERRTPTFRDHVLAFGPFVLCGAFCSHCSRMVARALEALEAPSARGECGARGTPMNRRGGQKTHKTHQSPMCAEGGRDTDARDA